MRIRATGLADVDLVAQLRVDFLCDVRRLDRDELPAGFADATAAWVRDHAERGVLHSWLAGSDDEVAGGVSLLLHPVPPQVDELRPYDGYVINMFVRPAHRRAGVGRALLDAIVGAAPSLGLRSMSLATTDEGRPLYESMGFAGQPDWMRRRL